MTESRKRTLVAGVFFICTAVAIHSFGEGDRPSVGWIVTLVGMWGAGVWLWPEGWSFTAWWARKWKRVAQSVAFVLMLAGMAALVLWAVDASERNRKTRETKAQSDPLFDRIQREAMSDQIDEWNRESKARNAAMLKSEEARRLKSEASVNEMIKEFESRKPSIIVEP